MYRIVSYCIVSYRIVSYRIVSYRIVSYRIVSYRIVSYRIVSYRIVSYRIVSYRIVLYCIVCLFFRPATPDDEFVLCAIQIDSRGVLSVQPDFNNGRKPYRLEAGILGTGRGQSYWSNSQRF